MSGNEINTLERNNYFKGKQLTVRDFQDEQSYHINKRRIFNYALLGSGVVSGLDVVAVDNMRVSIESGLAIDEIGREIVVAEPVVKATNVIDGFEGLDDTKEAFLCIEYAEDSCEPSHSLTLDNEVNYNRVREGYRLFFTNKKPDNLSVGLQGMLWTTKELFSSKGVSVRMTVPNYVNYEEALEVTVEIEKSNQELPVELSFPIEKEGFLLEGQQEIRVRYFNATDAFHKEQYKVRLKPEEGKNIGTLSVAKACFSLRIDKEELTNDTGVSFSTKVINTSVQERLLSDFTHRDIDNAVHSVFVNPIYLASLYMKKTKDNGFIVTLHKLPFRQLIMSNALLSLLEQARASEGSVFSEELAATTEPLPERMHREARIDKPKATTSCGVENIVIEKDARGKVYYSSEIIHNLGPGEVSYELGFELLLAGDEHTVVFGEENLFDRGPYAINCPEVKYSIVSYNDKGSFRIAVKLLERINAGNLKLHWYATKHGGDFDRNLIRQDRISIEILPETVNLPPRGSVKLSCVISGCDDKNCIWKVTDEQGGYIDDNGMYSAPSKAGVYEVTAASASYPNKIARKYIVVSTREGL